MQQLVWWNVHAFLWAQFDRIWARLPQPIQWWVGGALPMLLAWAIVASATAFGVSYNTAIATAFLPSNLWNFKIQKKLVFRNGSHRERITQLVKFLGAKAPLQLGSLLWFNFLTDLFQNPGWATKFLVFILSPLVFTVLGYGSTMWSLRSNNIK